MNICLIATASREGGALSIYNQVISALKKEVRNDRYYIFTDPTMPQEEIEGVKYFSYDTTGKKRIYFDACGFRKVMENVGVRPDVIVSFQNVAVSYPGVKQVIYFHNALPLLNKLWNPFLKDERTLFFYTSLYPNYIRLYLNKDMRIVVQKQTIKDLFVKKFKFNPENISVLCPDIELSVDENIERYDFEPETINLMYPSTSFKYKNQTFLADVVNEIKSANPEIWKKLRIHLTVGHGEIKSLVRKIEKFSCEQSFIFHGKVAHHVLMNMLASSDGLLFPSMLETIGIPLLEAGSFGLPIVANDKPYAHEAIGDYEGIRYASCNNVAAWANEVLYICNNKPRYKLYKSRNESTWGKFFELIREENEE